MDKAIKSKRTFIKHQFTDKRLTVVKRLSVNTINVIGNSVWYTVLTSGLILLFTSFLFYSSAYKNTDFIICRIKLVHSINHQCDRSNAVFHYSLLVYWASIVARGCRRISWKYHFASFLCITIFHNLFYWIEVVKMHFISTSTTTLQSQLLPRSCPS